ncbi:hypothetical protein RA210_U280026 [Rubrivivax sp. A210]|nr:hypothetical protein RA210_U280026 [Rubrivivax sp. A210]
MAGGVGVVYAWLDAEQNEWI